MKTSKWASVLSMVFFTMFLFACTTKALTNAEILISAEGKITIVTEATADVTLPMLITVEDKEVEVSWKTSHPNVISVTGVVARPSHDVGDIEVLLTATLKYGGEEKIVEFEVLVKALDHETIMYTVTFTSQDTVLHSVSVEKGSLVTIPAPPTGVLHHTFGGWEKEDQTLWHFEVDTVTSNITLVARWVELEKFDVTLDFDNGTEDEVLLIYSGDKLNITEVPVKLGYTFVGFKKADQTLWKMDVDEVISDITLTALYEVTTYTITYVYPDDAVVLTEGDVTYNINTEVTLLRTVELEHNAFLGWYDQVEGGMLITGYPEGTTGHKTLYGRFEADEMYTINFVDPMGDTTTQLKFLGQMADEPTNPSHAGYRFLGWYTTDEVPVIFDFETPITAHIDLNAQYGLITYYITYYGVEDEADLILTFNVESELDLIDPMQTHYEFIGWYDQEVGGNKIERIEKGTIDDLELYARFTPTTYQLTYHLDEGILEIPNPANYTTSSETITLLNPTKTGYEFIGWYLTNTFDEKVVQIPTGSFGDKVFYARFSKMISVSYYGLTDFEVTDIKISNEWPQTYVALASGQVLTKGFGLYGLIGNGSLDDTEQWQNITNQFNLEPNDYIVEIGLEDRQALARSNMGRLFVWGFFSDDGYDQYTDTPIDVSALITDVDDVVLSFIPLGQTFLFSTENKMYRFENYLIFDITHPSMFDTTFAQALPYSYNNAQVLAYVSNESVYLYDPFDTKAFIDVFTSVPKPDEDIVFVMAEGFSVHIVFETQYYYFVFTGDDSLPYLHLQVPLSLQLLENEVIVDVLLNGFLFTSQGRLLMPIYEDMGENEMPTSISYVDITDDVNLLAGETISRVMGSYFIKTSLGRVLFVMSNNEDSFDFVDIQLESKLLEDEVFIEMRMIHWEVYFVSNMRFASVSFEDEGIEITKLDIQATSLLKQEWISKYALEANIFAPVAPMYQVFSGWYFDEELTLPINFTELTEQTTLYASYDYTHYFVTIDYNDGSNIEIIPVAFGDIPLITKVPNRLEEHFEFVGWYYFDPNYESYDLTYPINKDVFLYAEYMTAQYEVTFIYDTLEPHQVDVYAYTYYGDIDIYVPEGYELMGVYLDEEKTIPLDLEMELEGPLMLYVSIEIAQIEIYYFRDSVTLSFEHIYADGNQSFGIASDGKVYAWGSNFQGALGIGFDHMNELRKPYDITPLFNLNEGDYISEIMSFWSNKVAVSNEGRVYVWGYYKDFGGFQGIVKEITDLINIEGEQAIQNIELGSYGVYIITNDGFIKYYHFGDESIVQIDIGSQGLDVIYLENIDFEPLKMFIVSPTNAYYMDATMPGEPLIIMDLSGGLNGDEVIDVKIHTQGYGQKLLYTKEGNVYLFDQIEMNITFDSTVDLNPNETLVKVFIESWDTMSFITSEDRLIGYQNETFAHDTSILLPGEKVIDWEYNNYHTNFGRSFSVNASHKLTNLTASYTLGEGEEVIDYILMDWQIYPVTNLNRIILHNGTDFMLTAGIDLVVVNYTSGTTFELLPMELRPGYTEPVWLDHYSNTYTDIPTETIFLYVYYWLED